MYFEFTKEFEIQNIKIFYISNREKVKHFFVNDINIYKKCNYNVKYIQHFPKIHQMSFLYVLDFEINFK